MTAGIVRATVYSFDSATWTAAVQLAGSVGESVLPVLETVSSGQLADGDQAAVLLFNLNDPNNGVVLGPFGSTGGNYNTPPIINQPATNGEVPIGRTSDGALVLAALTGTANQITVTGGAGSITLSAPQNIHTGASPTFAGLTVSALTSGRVVLASTSGLLADDADLAFNGTQLALATQGSTGGILIGGDAQLYRNAADVLRTPDSLIIDTGLSVGTTTAAAAGVIRAATAIYPTATDGYIYYRNVPLNAAATAVIADVNKPYAFVIIAETDITGEVALYWLRGGANAVVEVSDPSGGYSTVAGTANSHNIYYSAGNARYELENNDGGARRYRYMVIHVG